MSAHRSFVPAPLRLTPHDRILLSGRPFMNPLRIEGGWAVHDAEGKAQFLAHADVAKGLVNGSIVIERDHFRASTVVAKTLSDTDLLANVPPDELPLILWRLEFVRRFLKLEAAGEATRGDASLTAALARIHRSVCEMEIAKTEPVRRRAGKVVEIRNPPCARSFRRWLKRFESGGCLPFTLRPQTRNSGDRSPRLDAEVIVLTHRAAVRYAAKTRPTKAKLYQDLCDEITALNEARPDATPLTPPSKALFRKAIANLDAFEVYAGRHGVEAAKRKFNIVVEGLAVTRPLEMMMIDEWRVPLMTIAPSIALNPELKEIFGEDGRTVRVWITAAVDCATRVILALFISATPSSETAIAAIEQVVSLKQHLADAAGARSPYPGGGVPDLFSMDQSSSFIADNTHATIIDLGSAYDHPPAGLAHLRGHIKRLFGTLHTSFISQLDGRTFMNPVDKGDYDAEANVTLTVENFYRLLVRHVVDVYHNRPHEGLGGETPLNAWNRLTAEFGLNPPPDRDRRRHIFGVEVQRSVTARGVRFAGLDYQGDDLQAWRRRTGGAEKVAVRIDREDVGAVSVKIDGAWHTVPCVTPGLDLVAADTWIEAARDIARRHGRDAKVSAEIARMAAADIAREVEAARARNAIAWTRLSAADVERAEAEIRITIETRAAEAEAEPAFGRGEGGGAEGRPGIFDNIISPDAPSGGSRSTNGSEPHGSGQADRGTSTHTAFNIED